MNQEMRDVQDHPERQHCKVFSVCPSGVLQATVITPLQKKPLPPMLVLHGISRNAHELEAHFSPVAGQTGRTVVVPHLDAETWPIFQRITRRARPDTALLSLFNTLRGMSAALQGPFDLFGFSGGAQLAHRFAMLYPERVGDLYLGAAGWYTTPDTDCPYPYGLQDLPHRKQPWSRRMRSGMDTFLRRIFTVYVGEHDTDRDPGLRVNAELDWLQGRNRVERAKHYVSRVNAQQRALNLPQTASLVVLSGCGHSFMECAGRGDIALQACKSP